MCTRKAGGISVGDLIRFLWEVESTDTHGEEAETAKVTVSDLPGASHSLLAVFANLFFFFKRKKILFSSFLVTQCHSCLCPETNLKDPNQGLSPGPGSEAPNPNLWPVREFCLQ